MREASVVGEGEDRPFDDSQHIHVRSFGGERHSRSRQRRFAIESGAGQDCSCQDVGDGFQTNLLTHIEP